MALTQIKTAGIADDAVTSAKIPNDAIGSTELADDAITSALIADDAITSALIADDAVVTAAIADDAITSALIADDAVVTAAIADDAITQALIADDAVGLAQMASGTDGQIITYDASGNPAAVGPGTDGQVLTSTGAGSPPAFEDVAAGGKGKNLFINGNMRIDQRYGGSAHTIDGSDFVLDRWLFQGSGVEEQPTIQQVDVTADSAPWNAGFRKAVKITNGNQTGGAGGDDTIIQAYKFEAQDIANSGWDYTSASSYITLSFWVKASVAQDYPFYIRTRDGSAYMYSMMTGSLTADTWTKITKTLPGNSNITVNNDTGSGLELLIAPYYGTDGTVSSGSTLNAWKAWTASSRWNDITTTWYTTNDATFETTGFKLEVGDSATDYDHKSYADDLFECQRYCNVAKGDSGGAPAGAFGWCGGTDAHFNFRFPRAMLEQPSFTPSGTWRLNCPNGNGSNQTGDLTFIQQNNNFDGGFFYLQSVSTTSSAGDAAYLQYRSTGTKFVFDAEL